MRDIQLEAFLLTVLTLLVDGSSSNLQLCLAFVRKAEQSLPASSKIMNGLPPSMGSSLKMQIPKPTY